MKNWHSSPIKADVPYLNEILTHCAVYKIIECWVTKRQCQAV
jgi:hypothetical protein